MANFDRQSDARVRAAAFEWLSEQVAVHGDVLSWKLLLKGFELDGVRVPLVSPQGIFKPRVLDVPLSIMTSPNGPYDDGLRDDGIIEYKYRGDDPDHPDNAGLRFAMRERLPLIYLFGLLPGRYLPAWPVFVVGSDRASLTFSVDVDSSEQLGEGFGSQSAARRQVEDAHRIGRKYSTSLVQVRLHQRAFRERVLAAYRRECAFCRFRHEELLDAAHIIPDSDPEGEPVVSNGLSLCRLHHGAFDKHFIGLTPDYELRVRPDLLEEEDGPTLVGLQSLEGQRIVLPSSRSDRPDPELLERRYDAFQAGIARAG